MRPLLHTLLLSKKTLFASAVGATMLALSLYGFWRWINDAPTLGAKGDPQHLFYIAIMAIVPMAFFIIIAVRVASGAGYMSSSRGFQSRIDQLQKRLNEQDDFFRLVTDYTPTALTVFNQENEYWFVNASARQALGIAAEGEFLGLKPTAVLNPKRGRKIETHLDEVRKSNQTFEILNQEIDDQGQIKYIQASYHPLSSFGDFPGGVMLCEENVTGILVERERREDMLRQIISTLVAVVDRRDPYAAGHSARVGRLSRAIAVEMQLPAINSDAAEIAGSLMNFGKLLVSRAILTKTESLTPDELQRIRDGILTSADILAMIDFRAPVVPTLRQVLERFDGTGAPAGLKGEDILVTARIVAVANAFVAMVSPRAYRPGIALAVAVQRLSEESATAFDPRVIAVLENVLNKNKGKLDWLEGTK